MLPASGGEGGVRGEREPSKDEGGGESVGSGGRAPICAALTLSDMPPRGGKTGACDDVPCTGGGGVAAASRVLMETQRRAALGSGPSNAMTMERSAASRGWTGHLHATTFRSG